MEMSLYWLVGEPAIAQQGKPRPGPARRRQPLARTPEQHRNRQSRRGFKSHIGWAQAAFWILYPRSPGGGRKTPELGPASSAPQEGKRGSKNRVGDSEVEAAPSVGAWRVSGGAPGRQAGVPIPGRCLFSGLQFPTRERRMPRKLTSGPGAEKLITRMPEGLSSGPDSWKW